MKVLVTGVAGFVGFHVAKKLLQRGDRVVGFDNVNDYYDPCIKEARLEILRDLNGVGSKQFTFIRANLANQDSVKDCFENYVFDRVIHLAAQAGVRYSLDNPQAYVESNIVAFTNILEACRNARTPHLTYASTSSVYGANSQTPFYEGHGVNHPLQFYAATKRANELMAHSYSHLFRLPTSGLRFFTVYGPWGRPDMALFKFTKNILEGKPIQVFNYGNHLRDFTYIDDIVDGVLRVSDQIAQPNPSWNSKHPDPATSDAPFRIFNVGNSNPVKLNDYIAAIEDALQKRAIKELLPIQPGDALESFSCSEALYQAVNFRPSTTVKEGVGNFVRWYKSYFKI